MLPYVDNMFFFTFYTSCTFIQTWLLIERGDLVRYLLMCLSVRVRCAGSCGSVQTVIVTEILPKQKRLVRLLPRQTVTVIVKLERFPPANKPISWATSAHKTGSRHRCGREKRGKKGDTQRRKEKENQQIHNRKDFEQKTIYIKGRINIMNKGNTPITSFY